MDRLTEEQFNILAGIKSSRGNNFGVRADGSKFDKNEYYRNELFAKSLVKELYENIVYKEDFDIDPRDAASMLFAESILNYKNVEKVANSFRNRIPAGMTDSEIKEYAKDQADQLTELWAQEAKFQMIEVENLKEECETRNITPSSKYLSEKFGLFREFDDLMSIEKGNDGDFAKAVISEMDNSDKMKLAIRIDTFKNALTSVGIDANEEELNRKVHEAFEKNLFI